MRMLNLFLLIINASVGIFNLALGNTGIAILNFLVAGFLLMVLGMVNDEST